LVLALSVSLRVAAVSAHAAVPRDDAAEYHLLAENLVGGVGYAYQAGRPTAFRSCGYPLFLAAVYWVCGPNWIAVECVQAVLGGGTVLLVVALAWMAVGRREALLAGWLAAVYPVLVWLPRSLLSENLSVFLQLAALCATMTLLRRPGAGRAVYLGALLGLNLLVRGGSLFAAALIVSGVAATAGERWFGWQGLRLAVVAVAAAAATLAPWVARNYCVFHQFVPIATEDGITLYISYWPSRVDGKPIWGNLPGDQDLAVAEANRAGDEVHVSHRLREIAVARLLGQPAHALRLLPAKLLYLLVPLDWEMMPHARGRSRSVNLGYLAVIFPALAGGWGFARRRTGRQWVLWVSPVSVLFIALVFYGSPRFRLPAEPILIIFASCGLCILWDWAAGHGWTSAPMAPVVPDVPTGYGISGS
jgi:4-amino-4-deoxy-L-arabinose transferase-like glycosyltransferase